MSGALRRHAAGHFARLSDGQTHYQWHGPTRGPVLVLVHGLTTPSWVFAGLAPGLATMGYRVLTYDLYGRGFSDRTHSPQDRHLLLRQLRELLAELGVTEPVTLMGYSLGGALATIAAAEEPDRVERLVLLAPAGIEYTPAPLLARARDSGFAGDWLWGLLGARHLIAGAREQVSAPAPSVISDLPGLIAREAGIRGYLPAVLSAERHFLTERLEAEHRRVAAAGVPVISVWGSEDRTIPPSAIGTLAVWNREAWKTEIGGAGHGLPHTHPGAVLDALQTHLRNV